MIEDSIVTLFVQNTLVPAEKFNKLLDVSFVVVNRWVFKLISMFRILRKPDTKKPIRGPLKIFASKLRKLRFFQLRF